MKIAIFGTGYVGLISAVGFSDLGHHVIGVDNNKEKIECLKKGDPVIYEIGLSDFLKKNSTAGRIQFTSDPCEAIREAEILFLALPTPSLSNGQTDTSYLHDIAKTIGENMSEYKIIVNKSTAPVGTLKALGETIRKETQHPFDLVSNPEFLKEGTALNDFLYPDRIIIGSDSERAIEKMRKLYAPLLMNGHPILVMDIASAELTKYASNCMLATRIGLMNQLANLCDKVGANIEQVRHGMAKDNRIGSKFLYAGVGYGGSCFPKDMRSLIYAGSTHQATLSILEAVNTCNNAQWQVIVSKLEKHFNYQLAGKTFSIWGISFKPQTDDVREAPSLAIIKSIIKKGARVKAHDPVAIENAKPLLPKSTIFENNRYTASQDSDALLIITEWASYRAPNYDTLKENMKQPVIFDGRNVLNAKDAKSKGFTYYSIGKDVENG